MEEKAINEEAVVAEVKLATDGFWVRPRLAKLQKLIGDMIRVSAQQVEATKTLAGEYLELRQKVNALEDGEVLLTVEDVPEHALLAINAASTVLGISSSEFVKRVMDEYLGKRLVVQKKKDRIVMTYFLEAKP